MQSSASASPAAKPPGTSTPASRTRAPLGSVCTAIRSSAARLRRIDRPAPTPARSFRDQSYGAQLRHRTPAPNSGPTPVPNSGTGRTPAPNSGTELRHRTAARGFELRNHGSAIISASRYATAAAGADRAAAAPTSFGQVAVRAGRRPPRRPAPGRCPVRRRPPREDTPDRGVASPVECRPRSGAPAPATRARRSP